MSEWDHVDDEEDASVLFFAACNRERHFRRKRLARIRLTTSVTLSEATEAVRASIVMYLDQARVNAMSVSCEPFSEKTLDIL